MLATVLIICRHRMAYHEETEDLFRWENCFAGNFPGESVVVLSQEILSPRISVKRVVGGRQYEGLPWMGTCPSVSLGLDLPWSFCEPGLWIM